MNEPSSHSDQARKRRRGWILAFVFCFALIMGPGPGIMLVNTAKPFAGLPPIYLWGLLWYVVEVVVVILAFRLVWSDDDTG